MEITEIYSGEVIVVKEKQSVIDAARQMLLYNTGCVVVVKSTSEKNIPIGIITDRDIVLKTLAMGISAEATDVEKIMSAPLVTVTESASVMETLQKMREKNIRRVPVVDSRGYLAGILTFDDILSSISQELNEISQVFRQELPVI